MATLSFIMYVYGKNKNKNEIKKNTQINERKHKQICGKEGGVGWTTFCELNQWINASLHVCQPEFMSVRGIMYTRNILKKDLWKASLDDDKHECWCLCPFVASVLLRHRCQTELYQEIKHFTSCIQTWCFYWSLKEFNKFD